MNNNILFTPEFSNCSLPPAALCLQPVWDWMRSMDSWIKSPFFPVSFSLGCYLAFCLPYTVLDFLAPRVAFLRKCKLQTQNDPNAKMMANCLALTLYNHILYIFPVSVAHWYWRPMDLPLAAPELPKMLFDIVACLLLFDFQYFAWHVLHHKVPWLYRTFHKVHHKYTAPFAVTTEYTGAWETLSLGFIAAVNPAMLGCHPLTRFLFFTINIWLSVEVHSGYDFPWSTHRLVPLGLYGGAPHHDLHHMKFKINYAPYFTHCDRLLGTYTTLHKKFQ
ncbi:cholesterol 25-hydroxylase-like protein [Mobula hypostoma]|uniref:cholesterol 25-hydroxylase-like protein n=1 Tax=Mobula hypostoma TaxID=723540 RepID=UPI002FC2BBE9